MSAISDMAKMTAIEHIFLCTEEVINNVDKIDLEDICLMPVPSIFGTIYEEMKKKTEETFEHIKKQVPFSSKDKKEMGQALSYYFNYLLFEGFAEFLEKEMKELSVNRKEILQKAFTHIIKNKGDEIIS